MKYLETHPSPSRFSIPKESTVKPERVTNFTLKNQMK